MNVRINTKLYAVEVIYIDKFGNLQWVPEKAFPSRKPARDFAKQLRKDFSMKLCPSNMRTRVKRYILDDYI